MSRKRKYDATQSNWSWGYQDRNSGSRNSHDQFARSLTGNDQFFGVSRNQQSERWDRVGDRTQPSKQMDRPGQQRRKVTLKPKDFSQPMNQYSSGERDPESNERQRKSQYTGRRDSNLGNRSQVCAETPFKRSEIQTPGQQEDKHGGKRKKIEAPSYRNYGIGFRRLERWRIVTEPDELLLEVHSCIEGLSQLLSDKTQFLEKQDWIDNVLQIFALITQSSFELNKANILNILLEDEHLYKIVCAIIKSSFWSDNEASKTRVAKNLLKISEECMNTFKTDRDKMMGVPLDRIEMFITGIKCNEHFIAQIGHLKEKFKTTVNTWNSEIVEKYISTFRDLNVLPTADEIRGRGNIFLREIPTNGKFESGEIYLETQFLLIREDLLSPLRDGIREISRKVAIRDQKQKMGTFVNVTVAPTPNFSMIGVTHTIHFENLNNRNINWKFSKRLMMNNLLCFSKDNFCSLIYGVVAGRDVEKLGKGMLEVRFMDYRKCYDYYKDGEPMCMVESIVYFEAYRHVLEGFQTINSNDIPFQKYIVECETSGNHLPKYLKAEEVAMYDVNRALDVDKQKIDILDDDEWPERSEVSLNLSQLQAFKAALKKEFVVIQGPPGCGKTHLGLRIADTLLRNKKQWNKDNSPMLIVCYTNHALDQFLEGLVKYGYNDLTRAGGRMKHSLRKFSLYEKRRDRTRHTCEEEFQNSMKIRRVISKLHREREKLAGHLLAYNTENGIIEDLAEGRFISDLQYHQFMRDDHFKSFSQESEKCEMLGFCIFDLFLEISGITRKGVDQFLDENNQKEEGEVSSDSEPEYSMDSENRYQSIFKRVPKNRSIHQKFKKHVRQLTPEEARSIICHQLNDRNLPMMEPEDVELVTDVWSLRRNERWRLFKYWLNVMANQKKSDSERNVENYENSCKEIQELNNKEDELIMRKSSIVAMTTTGAAKHRKILAKLQPKIVIVEEAAEVLEAHVITSLTPSVEHLILIGDHKQLKPKPSVDRLAKRYNLDLSLFERMVNNGIELHTLDVQHRMRPEISSMLKFIYPNLKDADSVCDLPNVKGVDKNLFFISHSHPEENVDGLKSPSNMHEAVFLKNLCQYLLQQGYAASQISIVTGYIGQVALLKKVMPKSEFSGVHITSIDNYQGEENDIVLLSLVRSNTEKRVGFMKNENRACVALSRAKEGLYVIGNFDLFLQQKSLTNVWPKIIDYVKENGYFGGKLPLHCANHPSVKTEVSCEEDFKQMPVEGCNQSCDFRLKCGHYCSKTCHLLEMDHWRYKCGIKCENSPCGLPNHKCPRSCHFGEGCKPCQIPVPKKIPECGHTQQIKIIKNQMSLNVRKSAIGDFSVATLVLKSVIVNARKNYAK